MRAPHRTLAGILTTRLTNLQAVRLFWARQDARGTLEALAKAGEPAVLLDFLEVTEHKPEFFTLEVAAGLLPHMGSLLASEHNKYLTLAMDTAKKLIVAFRDLIRATREAPVSKIGLDFTAETRLERCNMCHRSLQGLRPRLSELAIRGGDIAGRARDLLVAIDTLGP